MHFPLLTSLFLAAFVAATILPAQSEALLATLIAQTDIPFWMLITVASIGNIAGSCVNWWLGRCAQACQNRKWFPLTPEQLTKAAQHYQRYGRWTLLLSWVPIIGDPLTLAAGFLRERFTVFLALVSIAKTGRYLVLGLIVSNML